MTSADWRERKQTVRVDGLHMALVEAGAGDLTFVLLHGNPTSSFLWRDVIPWLEPLGRVVAPDLVGMGDSDKLPDSGPGSYTLVEHRRYLDALLDEVVPDGDVVLVLHDWGSALGFDWARRHPDRVAGIAYMEAIVRPLEWDEWPRGVDTFMQMRTEEGERWMLDDNMFVEQRLPAAVLRDLSDDEMREYRRPFAEPGEGRRPTLTWGREIPLGGEPAEVVEIAQQYAEWLRSAPMPKLFVNAEPGGILIGTQREFCRTWPNQSEVTVAGIHYIQEDSGAEIGEAIAGWWERVRPRHLPSPHNTTNDRELT
jgi:haloalkane dehalogenase